MLINNNQQTNPSFGIRISSKLKLYFNDKSHISTQYPKKQVYADIKKQFDKLSSWGSDKFELSVKTDKRGKDVLTLTNTENVQNEKTLGICFKNTLLSTFLSIKEKDILKAQKSITPEIGSKADIKIKFNRLMQEINQNQILVLQ